MKVITIRKGSASSEPPSLRTVGSFFRSLVIPVISRRYAKLYRRGSKIRFGNLGNSLFLLARLALWVATRMWEQNSAKVSRDVEHGNLYLPPRSFHADLC